MVKQIVLVHYQSLVWLAYAHGAHAAHMCAPVSYLHVIICEVFILRGRINNDNKHMVK